MDSVRRSRTGLAGVVGGVGLLVYVLLKELWIPTVGGMAAFEARAGFSFHFLEVAPMALISAGMLGVYAFERDPEPGLADVALGLATVGVAAGTAGHAIEHTLFAFENPVGYVFTATHYVSLALASLGFTVYGLRADRSRVLGERERALFAATLPLAVVSSLVLGTFVFRAYADGYKIPVAFVAALAAYRLWRQPSDVDAAGEPAVADAST